MRQKPGTRRGPAEKVVKDIRRRTRKRHSAEEKIGLSLRACAAKTASPNSADAVSPEEQAIAARMWG